MISFDSRQTVAIGLLCSPESGGNIARRLAIGRTGSAWPVLANFAASEHRFLAIDRTQDIEKGDF